MTVRARLAGCWLAAAVACGGAVRAQKEQTFALRDGDRQTASVRVTAYAGSTRPGGFGFVRVDAVNEDDRPHVLRVGYESYSWSPNDLATGRTVALDARERARFVLPLPNTATGQCRVEIAVDGVRQSETLEAPYAQAQVGLLVTDRTDLTAAGVDVMASMTSPTRGKPSIVECRGDDAPDDWRLYTGFDLVLVDGRARLRAPAQDALRRFVHAGGAVLVAAPGRLPGGPLRDLAERAEPGVALRHGLGACGALDAFAGGVATARAFVADLPPPDELAGVLPGVLEGPQLIPGIGRAPVLGFLSVILVFAVLVGPVNFWVLRRRRRPMLALVTVPALGVSTTLLMLGYGMFHDGFGIRGCVRTWTVLDQERHEAATVGARTLFAGLAPGELQLDADAMVMPTQAFTNRGRRGADRWHYDPERSALDGGAVPSRTLVPLLEVRQGTARQRLRVRARSDGGLDVLADGGVAPVGPIVLRDHDGDLWTGDGAVLQRCDEAHARGVLGRLRSQAARVRMLDGDGATVADVGELAARVLGRELPAGGYATRVAAAPWLSDHGMDVRYEVAEHWLCGRLAAEDVMR